MKSIVISSIASICLLITGNIFAVDMPPVVQKFECTTCHKIDSKLIGPSWMEISRFYNGKTEKTTAGKTLKEATNGMSPEDWLVTKISKGGSGNWGKQPMLANDDTFHQPSQEKQQDIRMLVKFILGLAQ